MKHDEYNLQKNICRYLKTYHSDIIFVSDTVAFLQMTKGQAGRNKAIQKDGFSMPDMAIYEPRNGYAGLFIELKVESPYKKNGELKSQKKIEYKDFKGTKIKVGEYDHLQEQNKALEALKSRGYYACFSWGFDMTIQIIEDYLSGKYGRE